MISVLKNVIFIEIYWNYKSEELKKKKKNVKTFMVVAFDRVFINDKIILHIDYQ